MTATRKTITFFLSLFCAAVPMCASGQLIIPAGTQVAAAPGTDIAAQVSGSISNGTTYSFEPVNLNLILTGGTQDIFGTWNATSLLIDGTSGLVKNILGEIIVRDQLVLSGGIARTQSGRLVFLGNASDLQITAPGLSYIDGMFHQRGNGQRTFPVGKNGIYAPLIFNNIQSDTSTIGVEVVEGSPGLSFDVPVMEISNSLYWAVDAYEPGVINSTVTVGYDNASLSSGGSVVVVQSSEEGGMASNLFNESVGETLVTSRLPVTMRIVALGRVDEVSIKIRDLITPFGSDNVNQALYIEQLQAFTQNKVTLLDRWGAVVKEWVNYDNLNPGYDFSKLTPGNYICIVECSDADGNVKKETQMVTVLKIN